MIFNKKLINNSINNISKIKNNSVGAMNKQVVVNNKHRHIGTKALICFLENYIRKNK